MVGEDTPLRLGKSCQISVPSHPQIVDLLNEITHRISRRRRFNGNQVSKQTVVNCWVVALAELGPETWDYLFDHGASILGPASMAGEPNVPIQASRPLRKRFKWFDGHESSSDSEPVIKPIPPSKFRKDKDGGEGKELRSAGRTWQWTSTRASASPPSFSPTACAAR